MNLFPRVQRRGRERVVAFVYGFVPSLYLSGCQVLSQARTEWPTLFKRKKMQAGEVASSCPCNPIRGHSRHVQWFPSPTQTTLPGFLVPFPPQHVSVIFQYSHTGARAPQQAMWPPKRQFSFLNHSEYTPEVISGFDEN